jgi:hypothetical protein
VTRTASLTRLAAPRERRVAKPDQVCAEAVELAREAITEVPTDAIGDHIEVAAEGERLVTHYFACGLPGYRGWRWAVTVTRIARSKHVTVCETVLLPGAEALQAPGWVPWNERLKPGDLGVGDLLPTAPDDERLEPGYLLSDDDDPAVEAVASEIGIGKPRVLSRFGRQDTAMRWYEGDNGPEAPIAQAAPKHARCGGCGFLLPLAGSLRLAFGVCANLYAPDDGRVVSVDHGCGAHSEVILDPVIEVEELPTVYDDIEVEEVAVGRAAGSVEADEPAEPYGHG